MKSLESIRRQKCPQYGSTIFFKANGRNKVGRLIYFEDWSMLGIFIKYTTPSGTEEFEFAERLWIF